MSGKILVATPIRSFGELISQVLQEVGYYPLLVADVANALDASRVENFSLAIVDCKMPPPGTQFLAAALREQIDDLRLLFLHPDDSCHDRISLDPLRDVKLPQPFYLPDLLSTVEKMLPGQASSTRFDVPIQPVEIPTELIWLKDVNRAAQYLTRLSLEADAQAALIIRYGRIWAYAGQLPQSGAEELTHLIGQHWATNETGDLARFVRLLTTGTEYMLYATGMGAGFVLALAFETEMPFSKMRAQAGEIARKLTSPLPDLPEESAKNEIPKELEETQISKEPTAPIKRVPLPDIDDFSAEDWVPEDEASLDGSEDLGSDEAILAKQTAMFEDLLASIEIPDPDGASQPKQAQTKTALDHQVVETDLELPEIEEPTPGSFIMEPDPVETPTTQREVQRIAEVTGIHDLAYACVLIPRLPSHLLSGDLGALLNRAVTRLCLAFGWRLEHLAVRPQYLQWVVNVSPEVSAAKVIRVIRDQTSKLIFDEIPQLSKENPSEDFWAPGFMVVHGHSLTGDRVRDFIRQTRAQQGLDTL